MPLRRVLVVAVFAAVACSGSESATPTSPSALVSDVPCSALTTVTLVINAAATVDCSQGGTSFDLAGNGASYLVVPQFAASDIPNAATSFVLSATPSTSASIVAPPSGGAAATTGIAPVPSAIRTMVADGSPLSGPGALQRAFDMTLRRRARESLAAGRSVAASPLQRLSIVKAIAAPSALGTTRSFSVAASLSANNYTSVGARLVYAGSTVLLYVDTLSPAGGLSPSDLNSIGTTFDGAMYPIILASFGAPSDIDGNGRLIMLMTPKVNALTSKTDCTTQGYVAGFFDGNDLLNSANSNRGEVFYTVAPDPAATVSCAHDVSGILSVVPGTFLHEVQHLVNFSQHIVALGGSADEEGWLDEGLSIVAEELGSRYYETKYPAPSGRTNSAQLFPDSAEGFISGLLEKSYSYLLRPDTVTVTLHSDSDGGLAWRGSDWLLLRWLGDHKGEGIYQQLEHTTLTGTANIAAAAGESFASLFGDFALAMYTDSLVGTARSAVPARNRFVTRNLRQMYAALYRAAGPSSSVPFAFPITPVAMTLGANANGSMPPGTATYLRLDVPTGTAKVRLRFTAPGGAAIATTLKPQVAIYRLN